MEAIESLDKECSALGGLFQQVVNDMKVRPNYFFILCTPCQLGSLNRFLLLVSGHDVSFEIMYYIFCPEYSVEDLHIFNIYLKFVHNFEITSADIRWKVLKHYSSKILKSYEHSNTYWKFRKIDNHNVLELKFKLD